jgi:hypothetical protein
VGVTVAHLAQPDVVARALNLEQLGLALACFHVPEARGDAAGKVSQPAAEAVQEFLRLGALHLERCRHEGAPRAVRAGTCSLVQG